MEQNFSRYVSANQNRLELLAPFRLPIMLQAPDNFGFIAVQDLIHPQWVAVKELTSSYIYGEIMLLTIERTLWTYHVS